jgi:hypothetical protein
VNCPELLPKIEDEALRMEVEKEPKKRWETS